MAERHTELSPDTSPVLKSISEAKIKNGEGGRTGGMFLKGYSVLIIKHKRRYEELPENCLAYLSRRRAGTCLGLIVSLSQFFSVSLSLSSTLCTLLSLITVFQ